MSMNILQILKVISDIKLKEVTVTDKKGNASLKKVFECMLIACDKSIVKLVCWINAENVYNWLRALQDDLEAGEDMLLFFPDLTKSSKSPFIATTDGISTYDTENYVKFYIKTSYKNTIMDPDFVPLLATIEEANTFSKNNGFGKVSTWNTDVDFARSPAADDNTFDVSTLKKRKRDLTDDIMESKTPDSKPVKVPTKRTAVKNT